MMIPQTIFFDNAGYFTTRRENIQYLSEEVVAVFCNVAFQDLLPKPAGSHRIPLPSHVVEAQLKEDRV